MEKVNYLSLGLKSYDRFKSSILYIASSLVLRRLGMGAERDYSFLRYYRGASHRLLSLISQCQGAGVAGVVTQSRYSRLFLQKR